MAKENRIPSLDGVRAISILMVIAWHLQGRYQFPFLWRTDLGNLGVRTFFVISGFLITSLLLAELKKTGAINIRNFYIRRAFRIWPAYYVFLAIMAVTAGYGSLERLLPAVFYFSNYKLPPTFLEHTWSLSVEEQFYLLWPAALATLGTRKGTMLAALLMVVAPVFRVLFDLGHWHVVIEAFAFECVCDALAAGCLLALLRDRLWSLSSYRRLIESPLVWSIPVGAWLLWMAQPGVIVQHALCIPVLNISTALLLDRYMRFPSLVFGRVLNFGPVQWLGKISYSLYLWQQPWIVTQAFRLWRVGAALACAIGSHYLIERPALRMRRHLFRRTHKTLPNATA